MKFRAKIELRGKTATGIHVPDEIVAGLGTSKKPAVCVTIKGHTYRTSIASMGGEFMLPVSAEHREKAGVQANDEVEVHLEIDTEPREVTVPPDLDDALKKNATAKKFFEGLSYSVKLRFVLSVEQAKTAETRLRRIDKAISMLQEGKV